MALSVESAPSADSPCGAPDIVHHRISEKRCGVELDDEVCLCFHVTKRKLINYMRIERPRRAAQMSDCFGAGTGCGWCRAYIERLFAAQVENANAAEDLSAADHAKARADYVRRGGGTPPPGATPIDG